MKTTQQYFPVMLFIVLYKVVLTKSVVCPFKTKVIKKCFSVVLFTMLNKVVRTICSSIISETVKCDHPNEIY